MPDDHDPKEISRIINAINDHADKLCTEAGVCHECVAVNQVMHQVKSIRQHLDDEGLEMFDEALLDEIIPYNGMMQDVDEDDELVAALTMMNTGTIH